MSAGSTRISRAPPSPPKPSNAESGSSVGRYAHLIPFARRTPQRTSASGSPGTVVTRTGSAMPRGYPVALSGVAHLVVGDQPVADAPHVEHAVVGAGPRELAAQARGVRV